jgi:hypothetical protein
MRVRHALKQQTNSDPDPRLPVRWAVILGIGLGVGGAMLRMYGPWEGLTSFIGIVALLHTVLRSK